MTDTTDPQTDPLRIPIAHSVRYAARGLPDVPFLYGPGVIRASEITLTYRAAPDSQLGRVHAYVKGRLWVDEREVPTADGYGQHYDDGLDGWPEWLAEEARLHDPDAPSAAVSPPPATDRAGLLREVADECDKAGALYAARAQNEHAAGAFALMETFLRKANEAEYVATPCDFAACEPGGEPCSVHERLMAHAEGDHELCKPDCDPSRLAAGERDEQQAQQDGAVARDALMAAHVALAAQAGRDQAALARVRQLHDRLAEETDLGGPDDLITKGSAARRIATALDGWNPALLPTCPVEFEGGGICAKPAGHRPSGSDDPHVPTTPPAVVTEPGKESGRG